MHGFQLVSHSKCSSILYHLRDMTLSNIVTLKSRLGGHSFCKFVQDLYIAEIYRPGLSSGADSIMSVFIHFYTANSKKAT